MHPDLLQSMVEDRIAELRGGRNHRSVGPRSRRSGRSSRLTNGKTRVGQLFVRLGTSLIGASAGNTGQDRQHPSQPSQPMHPSRSEPACSVR
jgi:hypothetical protein